MATNLGGGAVPHDRIKSAARARQRETGEPYMTARRKVIAGHAQDGAATRRPAVHTVTEIGTDSSGRTTFDGSAEVAASEVAEPAQFIPDGPQGFR